MAGRPRFIFEEDHMDELRKIHAAGGPMGRAAKKFGVDRGTLSDGINRAGYGEEVQALYSAFVLKVNGRPARKPGISRIKLREVAGSLLVDTSLLHVRAAVMDWRRAKWMT